MNHRQQSLLRIDDIFLCGCSHIFVSFLLQEKEEKVPQESSEEEDDEEEEEEEEDQ